jgi:hypothetical protein
LSFEGGFRSNRVKKIAHKMRWEILPSFLLLPCIHINPSVHLCLYPPSPPPLSSPSTSVQQQLVLSILVKPLAPSSMTFIFCIHQITSPSFTYPTLTSLTHTYTTIPQKNTHTHHGHPQTPQAPAARPPPPSPCHPPCPHPFSSLPLPLPPPPPLPTKEMLKEEKEG